MSIRNGIFVLGGLILFGCTNKVVYKQAFTFADSTWTYDNLLQYQFSIQDTSSLYSLNLNVIHDPEYPFQNLYIKIRTGFPNGSSKEDVVSLEFADDNGLWNGNCRQTKCQLNIPLQEKTYFF